MSQLEDLSDLLNKKSSVTEPVIVPRSARAPLSRKKSETEVLVSKLTSADINEVEVSISSTKSKYDDGVRLLYSDPISRRVSRVRSNSKNDSFVSVKRLFAEGSSKSSTASTPSISVGSPRDSSVEQSQQMPHITEIGKIQASELMVLPYGVVVLDDNS